MSGEGNTHFNLIEGWTDGNGYIIGMRLSDKDGTVKNFGYTSGGASTSHTITGPINEWKTWRDPEIRGIRVGYDDDYCVTRTPALAAIPTQRWILRSESSNYNLALTYTADTAWPTMNQSTNKCYGTWEAPTISSATYNSVVDIPSAKRTDTLQPYLEFDDSGIANNALPATYTDPMITFTVTVEMETDDDWYPFINTSTINKAASRTFTVQILEPCTSTDLTFNNSIGPFTMAVGASADTGAATLSGAHTTYTAHCAKTYYWSDGGCSFCTKAHSST